MPGTLDYTATQINGSLARSVSPDTTPTVSSTKFVTSGGVQAALAALQDDITTLQREVATLMDQMALTEESPVKTELESLDSRVTALEP